VIGERLGEIVESGTRQFVAEASELHRAPAFGSLVCVCQSDRPTIMGMTFDVTTGSLDTGRRPLARGRAPDRYDERIYDAFPELRETLRTQFSLLVVGYRDGTRPYQYSLPPQPVPLHYSVCTCTPDEQYAFTASFDYFHTVIEARDVPADELLVASIRHAAALRGLGMEPYLLGAGQSLARLLRDDYDRLVAMLRRIAPAEVQ